MASCTKKRKYDDDNQSNNKNNSSNNSSSHRHPKLKQCTTQITICRIFRWQQRIQRWRWRRWWCLMKISIFPIFETVWQRQIEMIMPKIIWYVNEFNLGENDVCKQFRCVFHPGSIVWMPNRSSQSSTADLFLIAWTSQMQKCMHTMWICLLFFRGAVLSKLWKLFTAQVLSFSIRNFLPLPLPPLLLRPFSLAIAVARVWTWHDALVKRRR